MVLRSLKAGGLYSLEIGNGKPTNPSGVTSVEARPPGVSLESIIIHDGPFCNRVNSVPVVAVYGQSHDLIQTLCSTQTCWTSTNDENVNVTAKRLSAGIGIGGAKTWVRELVVHTCLQEPY